MSGSSCLPTLEANFKVKANLLYFWHARRKPEILGGIIWDGAIVLSNYLETCEDLKGKRVIELGAGLGLCGFVSALGCGASEVVVTDIGEHVELTRQNIQQNNSTGHMRAEELWWGNDTSPFGQFDIGPARLKFPPPTINHDVQDWF